MHDEKSLQELQSQGQRAVTEEEGQRLAKDIGAFRFVKCSSKLNKGIEEAFDAVFEAAEAALPAAKPNAICNVL